MSLPPDTPATAPPTEPRRHGRWINAAVWVAALALPLALAVVLYPVRFNSLEQYTYRLNAPLLVPFLLVPVFLVGLGLVLVVPGLRRWAGPAVTAFAVIISLALIAFGSLNPRLIVPLLVPMVLIGLLAIWALPSLRSAPTAVLEGLWFAFFVALVMWPNYIAIALPGLPWITMIRLTGFPLLIFLLVCVSVSKTFRDESAEALDGIAPVWKLLVAFTLVQVLSVALCKGGQIPDALQRLVIYLTSWTAVFFASVWLFRQRGRIEIWATLMCAAIVPIGAIALQEERHSHVPWSGHIPKFLQIDPTMLQGILAGNSRAANGIYRVQSVFTTPLTLAEYLAFCFPFLIHFTVARGYRVWVRVAAAALMPFTLYIIFLSGSRLGMVGALVSMLGYGFFWGVNRWRRDKRSLLGAAVVFSSPLSFLAAVATTYFDPRLHAMVWGTAATKASNEGRVLQYRKGLPLVFHHPWGYGIDQGAQALGIMATDGKLTIDTYFLAIALNYGVLGFILYYAMLLWAIWEAGMTALRAPPDDRDLAFLAPLGISLAVFFVICAVFAQQDNIPIVFMMLGGVVALVWRYRVLAGLAVRRARRLLPTYRSAPRPALARQTQS
ncbi:MAG TPA: O-antigen ligase family protein [Caulobacteraceae bacterium]|nr:O-antigen ligase family protein [Caulobacteraceae bacterium]